MVQVDSKTIYLIGGQVEKVGEPFSFFPSNRTWMIDPTNNFVFKEGPPMICGRAQHSCATMRVNGKMLIIVVGGIGRYTNSNFTDVEILDTSSPTNIWTKGL